MGLICSVDVVAIHPSVAEPTRSSSAVFISRVDRHVIISSWQQMSQEQQNHALEVAFGQMVLKNCHLRQAFVSEGGGTEERLRNHARLFVIFMSKSCELLKHDQDQEALRLWRSVGRQHIRRKRVVWSKDTFQIFGSEIGKAIAADESKWESDHLKQHCEQVWKMFVILISNEMRHSLYKSHVNRI